MSSKKFARLIAPNDASITTWLTAGALFQLLSISVFPRTLSVLLPITYAIYRLAKAVKDSRSVYTGTFTSVKRGRWTAQLPAPGSTEPRGIVCFVLGARFNHPLGKAAPGVIGIAGALQQMWTEAEENREKWGFLGRTSTLIDISDGEATSMAWLSYWNDMEGLQKFSESSVHRLGQTEYIGNKYPYIGIMHETFKAPEGCWETIYLNMPPWGLGKSKPLGKDKGDATEDENILQRVLRPEQENMYRRMRGKM
ncbi:hypothetical protein BDV95DRAFT_637663 [Massariosphaeria phaeospora]|uniref:Uncharacterized protein n=1 Tax=Massariosphaeria phaeospora TaxID=100035 RepID=A0A7C8ME60_9PLEO|nr:hypothetical protein BDV95DRAFT_637663 [Massariosphaeria phaeospora]